LVWSGLIWYSLIWIRFCSIYFISLTVRCNWLMGLSSYTSKHFFCTSKKFLNSQNTLWPFKETHRHHTPKNTSGCRLSEVKIYDFRKSKSSPEVDFWKSKINTGSQFSKIKNHYRKLTSGSQKSSPEVDFRKSKHNTEIDFRI